MREMTVAIAGVRFQRGASEFLARLPVGTALILKREPDNPFDAFAIGIWRVGIKLGFVPKTSNVEVAWVLDAGTEVTAFFTGHQEAGTAMVTLAWS